MLVERIQKISAETQQIKQEIYEAIKAQTPPDDTTPWYKIIQLKKLERGILLAAYYNTGGQLRRISDYVIEDPERSLDTILHTFQSIVKVGRAPAFPQTMFNDNARSAIQSLL